LGLIHRDAGSTGAIVNVPLLKFDDYAANYSKGASNHTLPAPLLPFVYQEVRRSTLAAHVALGCRGVSRADFRSDDRIEGMGASAALRGHPAQHDRDVTCAGVRSICGRNI
jgi:D-alanine-D-alanine ligase